MSAFGVGGTNVHVVLEEPPAIPVADLAAFGEPADGQAESTASRLLIVSARSETALAAAKTAAAAKAAADARTAADAARNGNEIQNAFAEGVESYLQTFAAGIDGNTREKREKSIALLSSLTGALMLSRAVKKSNPKLSDELLSSARKQLRKSHAPST